MRRTVYIGAGSFLGAIARYLLKSVNIWGFQGQFPLNTLLINLTGSFFLALILTLTLDFLEFDPDVRLGLTTGFLGAFTTFSTLCKETAVLLSARAFAPAALYLFLSVALGLTAAYLGILLARRVVWIGRSARESRPSESKGDAK